MRVRPLSCPFDREVMEGRVSAKGDNSKKTEVVVAYKVIGLLRNAKKRESGSIHVSHC